MTENLSLFLYEPDPRGTIHIVKRKLELGPSQNPISKHAHSHNIQVLQVSLSKDTHTLTVEGVPKHSLLYLFVSKQTKVSKFPLPKAISETGEACFLSHQESLLPIIMGQIFPAANGVKNGCGHHQLQSDALVGFIELGWNL